MSTGSFTEQGAPSSSSAPLGPDGSGLGTALPPPLLVPNPGRAEGRILPHAPCPPRPAFPDGFCGGPSCCPCLPRPPQLTLSPRVGASGVLGAVSEQRAPLNLAEEGRTAACRGGGVGEEDLASGSPCPAGPMWLLGATYASTGKACHEPTEQLALNE